jgi:hypothetical protein
MRGAFKGWAVNGTRRFAQQSVYFVPPMVIAYVTPGNSPRFTPDHSISIPPLQLRHPFVLDLEQRIEKLQGRPHPGPLRINRPSSASSSLGAGNTVGIWSTFAKLSGFLSLSSSLLCNPLKDYRF